MCVLSAFLIIALVCSCKEEEWKTIYLPPIMFIEEPPEVDFTADRTWGKDFLTVNFTDLSPCNPDSWEWDFDNDGVIDSTEQNPTHTYEDYGWYTVSLRVRSGAGEYVCTKPAYIQVAASIICVSPDGVPSPAVISCDAVFQTLNAALTAHGDNTLFLVCRGRYAGPENKRLYCFEKTVYFKSVDGHGAAMLDLWDDGYAFCFYGPQRSVLDGFDIRNGGDFEFGAVNVKEYAHAVIKNCQIRNWYSQCQPALLNWWGWNVTINNCLFENNVNVGRAGGALMSRSRAILFIEKCTFKGNYSYYSAGGAISTMEGTNYNIVDCRFEGNYADVGGAIDLEFSNVRVERCTFYNNRAGYIHGGGAIAAIGSGPGSWREVKIKDCELTFNLADIDNVFGGGAVRFESIPFVIDNCYMSYNDTDGPGGAVVAGNCIGRILDSRFKSNESHDFGGAIAFENTIANISRCVIRSNAANNSGGGISLMNSAVVVDNTLIAANNARWFDGGGAACYGSDPFFVNCTFADNRAGFSGGGIYLQNACNATAVNTIICRNKALCKGAAINLEHDCSTILINYSCYPAKGNYDWFVSGSGRITGRYRCVSTYPMFRDVFGIIPEAYDLRPSSPCIGRGCNEYASGFSTDLAGRPRCPGTVDIGAYEFSP